jgi:hypothetical protein
VFVRASISFSAGAVRRNVTISSAGRLSHAGRKFRGIAGHSKQRYRAGWRRCFVLPSNISFKADGFAAA